MNTLTITVDGVSHTLDIEGDCASVDIDEDMTTIAPMLAWYGRLLAQARWSVDVLEADLKRWKAATTAAVLADNPKLAEWKVKAEVESQPAMNTHLRAIADAWVVANRLDSAFTALKVKADMLRSRGAMLRSELDNTNMATKNDKVAATRRALRGTN